MCCVCETFKPLDEFDKKRVKGWKKILEDKPDTPEEDLFYLRGTCKECVSNQRKALEKEYEEIRAESPPIVEKMCNECHETLGVHFYYPDDSIRDGLSGKCVKCSFMKTVLHDAQKDTVRRNETEYRERKLECTITIEDLEELRATGEFCPITGTKLVYCCGMVNMASLDRIDDDIGYVRGNIRFVDTRVNTPAKWTGEKWNYFCTFSDETPVDIPSETKVIDGFTLRTKLLKIKNSANSRNRKKIKRMKKKGEVPPNLKEISIDDIYSLWNRQQGRCLYSQLPMCWGIIKNSDWTISIERLEQGWYETGNIALIVAECNSSEYRTKRFDAENAGNPVGWNADVVADYRRNYVPA